MISRDVRNWGRRKAQTHLPSWLALGGFTASEWKLLAGWIVRDFRALEYPWRQPSCLCLVGWLSSWLVIF